MSRLAQWAAISLAWLGLLNLTQSFAQSTQPQEDTSWVQMIKEVSERVSEAPVPPPVYLRRRWAWVKSQQSPQVIPEKIDNELSSEVERSSGAPALSETPLSRLWSLLGQGGTSPLYETPQQRSLRRAEMDLKTEGTPRLPVYTHEFIPHVYPHKRMTSWNLVTEDGQLGVQLEGLTEVETIGGIDLMQCAQGEVAQEGSEQRNLSLGDKQWIRSTQLNLSCVQRLCTRRGLACFLGIFSLEGWDDLTRPRGVASVSPEQSLLTINDRSAVILSQDDAGNFYISAPPESQLGDISKLVLPIGAPLSYFSGSWSSRLPLSAVSHHPDLKLPEALKREALFLAAQLGWNRDQAFERLLFDLTDWFRSFQPGEQPKMEGSVYRRLTLSQIGVCRHRSYAFLITARALGIPTRYVTNQVHAFVEVLDPEGRWRRVDLGGEGLAPEDETLTRPLREKLRREEQPFHVDDGLPRPAPYQRAAELAALQRGPSEAPPATSGSSISSSDQPEKRVTSQPQEASNSLSSTPALEQQEPHSETPELASSTSSSGRLGVARDATRQSETAPSSHSTFTSGEGQPEQAVEGEGGSSGTAPSSETTSSQEQPNQDQQYKPTKPRSSEDFSFSLGSLQPHANVCSIDPQLLLPERQFDTQTANIKLNQLIRRLIEAQSQGIPPQEHPQSPLNIQFSLEEASALHRCALLTLRGQVQSPQSKRRYPPRGTWVMSALVNTEGGRIISGWGKIGRRGRFLLRAQIPSDMIVGSYSILTYFPAQRSWPAGWSELTQ